MWMSMGIRSPQCPGVEGVEAVEGGAGRGALVVIIRDIRGKGRVEVGNKDMEEKVVEEEGRRGIVGIMEGIMRKWRLGGRMIFGDLKGKVATYLEGCFSFRLYLSFLYDTMGFAKGMEMAFRGGKFHFRNALGEAGSSLEL